MHCSLFLLVALFCSLFRTAMAQTIDQAVESTALVSVPGRIGSGVLVAPQYLITNAHVISHAGCGNIRITWRNKATNRCAAIIAIDRDRDIAALRLEQPERRVPLKIEDFRSAAVGEELHIIGNPEGQLFVVSRGIVSSREDRYLDRGEDVSDSVYFSMDANINPGNSGGPVLNRQLAVIGLATYIKRGIAGSGFAIRSDQIIYFLQQHKVSFAIARQRQRKEALPWFLSFFASNDDDAPMEPAAPPVVTSAVAPTNGTRTAEAPAQPTDWSGIRNPFDFGGLKLTGRLLGGVDYGDLTAHDAGVKGSHLGKLWMAGAQGFLGAQIGLEGRGSSTLGAWYTSYLGSPRAARNAFYEQKAKNPLKEESYRGYLDDEVDGEASRLAVEEREFGVYLGNFWRVSAGFGEVGIELNDGTGMERLRSQEGYKVLTTGFLLGSAGWGMSLDVSKLYHGFYRRTSVRGMVGVGYTFGVFD